MLIRALLAFLLLPGIFAGLLPWLIAELDPWKGAAHYTGLIFAAAGLLMLLRCVGDFYRSGRGTLAPWNPPKNWSPAAYIGAAETPCTWPYC